MSPRGGPIPWQLAKHRGHRLGRGARPARTLTGLGTFTSQHGDKIVLGLGVAAIFTTALLLGRSRA